MADQVFSKGDRVRWNKFADCRESGWIYGIVHQARLSRYNGDDNIQVIADTGRFFWKRPISIELMVPAATA